MTSVKGCFFFFLSFISCGKFALCYFSRIINYYGLFVKGGRGEGGGKGRGFVGVHG